MNHEGKCGRNLFWEALLVRELTYLIGGMIAFIAVMRALGSSVTGLLQYVSYSGGFFVIFLLIAYFVGLISQKGFAFLGILRVPGGMGTDATQWASEQVLATQAGQKLDHALFNDYERIGLRAQAAANLGSGALVGALCWLIALLGQLGDSLSSMTTLIYLLIFVLFSACLVICMSEIGTCRKQRAALIQEFKRLTA